MFLHRTCEQKPASRGQTSREIVIVTVADQYKDGIDARKRS